MMLDNYIHVYVAGEEREEWALKIASVLEYATLIEATGVTREWGNEPVVLVECAFDHDRSWSVYDDLFPVIREYAEVTRQDCVYVTCYSHRFWAGHLLLTSDSDSEGGWFELASHICLGR
jgi:hypothetical protein